MPTTQQLREKLVSLLQQLFQLDQPDFDFGFYRIMHAKAAHVAAFLENDLLTIVGQAFGQAGGERLAAMQKGYEDAIAQAKAFNAPNPEQTDPVKKAKAALEAAKDTSRAEGEVYDHLYRFFERYYEGGDFMSRRYLSRETGTKAAPYAVPYDGSEIYLHWANKDQYYIKTAEYFTDFTFDPTKAPEVESLKATLFPNTKPPALRVHFRVISATEGEHGNVKASDATTRYFILCSSYPVEIDNGELICRFEYRPDPEKTGQEGAWQAKRNDQAVAGILEALVAMADTRAKEYLAVLKTPAPTEKQKDRPILARYVAQYAGRNTTDYFIHKDLGGFLKRELDFYCKNEIIRLDDIESADAPKAEAYIDQVRCLRQIAGKIITFLAQLEDFQKSLWLKKKFVIECNYCIALAHVPAAFHSEIIANNAQRDEWVRLCSINDIKGDLATPGYTSPLTPSFLKAHPTLLVDTRHFGADFRSRLIAVFNDLDEQTDGMLFHAENFQGIRVLQKRMSKQIECIYIDPPYNTGDSEIPYRNAYLRSSWLSLMENRLDAAMHLLAPNSVLFVAIDDFEMVNLSKLIDVKYPFLQREMIIVNHHPQGGKAKTLAHTHEYMLACVDRSSDRTLAGRTTDTGVEQRPFKRSGTAESNFRYGRPNSFYAILVDPASRRVVGLEPPPTGSDYPSGTTTDGHKRVYPIGANGEERVWRRSYESCLALIEKSKLVCSDGNTIYQLIEAHERTSALFSNWVDSRYNAGTFGANLLRDIVGEQNVFAYPKSIHTVGDAVFSVGLEEGSYVLDYFGGSGTTGHAVINLNREDDGRRKFILIEMGDHFETVLLPRIKKVTFAPEWKGGKPKRLATGEEAERSPRIIKIGRFESYEDSLNNLELKDDAERHKQLEQNSGLREDYMLHYMLDVETVGSASLLNIDQFKDPTAYKLKVKKPSSDEYDWKNVDLLETFNYLLGLRVEHISAPQTFAAEFERQIDTDLPKGQLGRLTIKGKLKQAAEEAGGRWWFRKVEGWLPKNAATPNDGQREKVLIVWRKLTGDIEQDNLVLDEWFRKYQINPRESYDYDTIYVNGSNNLPNLKLEKETWRVRLIEEDFHRLMWDTDEA